MLNAPRQREVVALHVEIAPRFAQGREQRRDQTGRGDDFTAALDKFVAASPIVVAAVIEAYWLGAHGLEALTWRHHAVAVLWSAFAVTDFFATDITNQRLRARQFNVGDSV